MSANLGLATFTGTAFSEVAFNDGAGAVDAALTAETFVSVQAGNVALTAAQFRAASSFRISGATASGASLAGRKVTLPAVKGLKIFRNLSASQPITITSGLTSIVIDELGGAMIYNSGDVGGIYLLGVTVAPPASVWPGTQSPTESVFSDFKNGVYRIGGVSKTLAEVWETNASYGTFSAANITANGFERVNANVYATMTAAAYAAGIDAGPGFVCQITCVLPDTNNNFGFDWWEDPGFSQDGGCSIGRDKLSLFTPPGNESAGGLDTGTLPAGTYKIAFAMTPELLVIKADNGLIYDVTEANPSPVISAFSLSLSSAGTGSGLYVEKVAFYQVESDLDLVLAL